MNKNKSNNNCKSQRNHNIIKREQPRKNSKVKRINEDNARIDKVERDIERDSSSRSANDISWYSRNPELLKAAGSIPFAAILGSPVSDIVSQRVPGILVLNWQPGYSSEALAINQSFNAQYSFVVHANSRNYAYTAPDLGMLEMAGMDVFNILSSMIRAFGIVKFYEYERNLYYPGAILQTLGFQFKDLRKNMSQMWFDINNLINQTKQIWVPNIMPIADRWFWMNSNYFTDAPGTTSQTYVYNQDRYYILNETGMNTGTCLCMINADGTPHTADTQTVFSPGLHTTYTWSQWVTIAQSMIDALIQSEDRGIIFGDILNAYTADKIRALPTIPSDYVLPPTFNSEVLMQIENASWCGAEITGFAQYNEQIVTCWSDKPIASYAYYGSSSPAMIKIANASSSYGLLNFHFPTQPTPEQVTIATRAKSAEYVVGNHYAFNWTKQAPELNAKAVSSNLFCSELYHSCEMVRISGLNGGEPIIIGIPVMAQLYDTDDFVDPATKQTFNFRTIELIQSFDWHPFIQVASLGATRPAVDTAGTASQSTPIRYIGDFDNYAALSPDNLRKLHTMCIYSLLGIPQQV